MLNTVTPSDYREGFAFMLALKQYADLKEHAADMDAAELMDARLAIREEKERSAVDRVKSAYGENTIR